MIRRPPRSTLSSSSAASDVYKRQQLEGAVYTYEVTNKGNQWHPHIHILALVPDYVDLGFVDPETGKKTRFGAFQDALIEEWKEITGDSMIVDAREVGTTDDSRIGAFCEVF